MPVIIKADWRVRATLERAEMGEKGLQAIVDPVGRRAFIKVEEERSARPISITPDAGRSLGKGMRSFPSAKLSRGGLSIDAGARALANAFSAAAGGAAFDMSLIASAGEQIIDGVAELGLAKWLSTVRRYHEGTFQHCLLVTGVATSFGHRSGMRRSDVATLTVAALLHDIGKARIPIAILDKPGKLTDDEYAVIKTHPAIGWEYLRDQGDAPVSILSAVKHHHEYLDGSGYPDGLCDGQIDDITRILTVCDIYAALVESRAYKSPKTPDEAVAILLGMAAQGKLEESLVKVLTRA